MNCVRTPAVGSAPWFSIPFGLFSASDHLRMQHADSLGTPAGRDDKPQGPGVAVNFKHGNTCPVECGDGTGEQVVAFLEPSPDATDEGTIP